MDAMSRKTLIARHWLSSVEVLGGSIWGLGVGDSCLTTAMENLMEKQCDNEMETET